MANEDIRQMISQNNLKYWQVANKYGLSDGNFSRKLRIELPQEEKSKIINIIKLLANQELKK